MQWELGRSASNPRGFWFHFAEVEMGPLPFPPADLTLSSSTRHLRKSPVSWWPLFYIIWPLSLVYSPLRSLPQGGCEEILPSTGNPTNISDAPTIVLLVRMRKCLLGLIMKWFWLDPIIHTEQGMYNNYPPRVDGFSRLGKTHFER